MEKLCVIFGAGETYSPRKKFSGDDLIIAADGGYAAAVNAGLEPSVIIGDFDSGSVPQSAAAHIIKLNRDKDETDMLAAVKLGIRRGYKTFVLYGGVGGRLDHTVANIAVLCYLNAFGARGYLIDRDSVCTVITDDEFILPPSARGTVSVFAYGGEAFGVDIKGLSYRLENARLTPEFPIGVSNATASSGKIIEFAEKKQRPSVSVKTGSLLIFFPR